MKLLTVKWIYFILRRAITNVSHFQKPKLTIVVMETHNYGPVLFFPTKPCIKIGDHNNRRTLRTIFIWVFITIVIRVRFIYRIKQNGYKKTLLALNHLLFLVSIFSLHIASCKSTKSSSFPLYNF